MTFLKTLSLPLLCLSLLGCEKVVFEEKPPAQVKTFTLPAHTTGSQREFHAVARAQDLTEMSFREEGKIANIFVTNGQAVSQGQLLAVLDKRDYQATLNDRTARKEASYNQYQRATTMLEKKLMAQSEFDQMKAQYLVDKAQHRMAELGVEYTELRAPFDGVVSDVYLDSFENILPGTPILSMHKLDFIEVDVQVPDSLVAVAKRKEYREKKREYKVVFEAYPGKEFMGTILDLNSEKDPSTRSFIVTLSVPLDHQFKVLEGMPARVFTDLSDVTYTHDDHFLVPLEAVVAIDGSVLEAGPASVWIYNPETQTVSARAVKVGAIIGTQIEVLDGLKNGEIIITEGTNRLTQNQPVKLMQG